MRRDGGLDRWAGENAERRRAVTACTKTRWSRGREAKTDRRRENAGDAHVTAMGTTTIKHTLNKDNALWG